MTRQTQISASARREGERYKAAVIKLRELLIAEWPRRHRTVDRSELFRALHEKVLKEVRDAPIDRSRAVIFFKNSVATEWESIRQSYPPEVRQSIRKAVKEQTGIDPHAMYMATQRSVLAIIEKGRVTTSRQWHQILEFMDGLDADDEDLRRKCRSMLNDFEAAKLKAKTDDRTQKG